MAFDPMKHMRKLSGKDYLDVKFRLVWLREDNPNASIETELVEHTNGEYAVFRAKVVTSEGAVATGYGSETIKDFRDYLEKAETKAIGRALGALGYGTQFADDFSYEREEPTVKVVDSPVQPKQPIPPKAPSPQVNGASLTDRIIGNGHTEPAPPKTTKGRSWEPTKVWPKYRKPLPDGPTLTNEQVHTVLGVGSLDDWFNGGHLVEEGWAKLSAVASAMMSGASFEDALAAVKELEATSV